MPAQVIGRDVEHHGHLGREERGRSQLVRRGLGNEHIGSPGRNRLQTRIADVADRLGGNVRAIEHVRDQRRRGRLAVRARYRHPAGVGRALAPGEFHFADDLGRGFRGTTVEIGELGDARRRHAHIVRPFDLAMVEQYARASGLRGFGERERSIGLIPRGNRHALDAVADKRAQIGRCGPSAFSEPQNEHAPERGRGVLLGRICLHGFVHPRSPPQAIGRSRWRSRTRRARPR